MTQLRAPPGFKPGKTRRHTSRLQRSSMREGPDPLPWGPGLLGVCYSPRRNFGTILPRIELSEV